MLDTATLHLRQVSVYKYLTRLEDAAHGTWQGQLESAEDLPSRLMLVHPKWHAQDVATQLGLLDFSGTARGHECQALKIWGYDCPLTDRAIQADHVFPKALGGPRDGTNQIWLCDDHNRWKGPDLISFPWEWGEPSWLGEQIERVQRLVGTDATWHG